MPELLTVASRRKERKSISAESAFMSSRRPNVKGLKWTGEVNFFLSQGIKRRILQMIHRETHFLSKKSDGTAFEKKTFQDLFEMILLE